MQGRPHPNPPPQVGRGRPCFVFYTTFRGRELEGSPLPQPSPSRGGGVDRVLYSIQFLGGWGCKVPPTPTLPLRGGGGNRLSYSIQLFGGGGCTAAPTPPPRGGDRALYFIRPLVGKGCKAAPHPNPPPLRGGPLGFRFNVSQISVPTLISHQTPSTKATRTALQGWSWRSLTNPPPGLRRARPGFGG